jgi:hypothetical protein
MLDDSNSATRTKRRRHVKGQHDWEKNDALKRLYGERGEEIVRLKEIERLREEGHENPETAVRWLRREDDDADHDFESLIKIDGTWHDLIIEVKATPGTDFRVTMSIPELECARYYGDRYLLYRVTRVRDAAPEVYVFGNPLTMWLAKEARIRPQNVTVELPEPPRTLQVEERSNDKQPMG